MLKGIIEKLFKTPQSNSPQQNQSISLAEVESIVETKLKEHAAELENNKTDQISLSRGNSPEEDYTLSPKQIEYAHSLIEKVKGEFVLAIDPIHLTIKDLNRLIAYNRYKNKGTLINLVKKGVLKKK
jgi:hypothetical protein